MFTEEIKNKQIISVSTLKTFFKIDKERFFQNMIEAIKDPEIKFSLNVIEFLFDKIIEEIKSSERLSKFPSSFGILENRQLKIINFPQFVTRFPENKIIDFLSTIQIDQFKIKMLIKAPNSIENLRDFYFDKIIQQPELHKDIIDRLLNKKEYDISSVNRFFSDINIHSPIISEENTKYYSIKINENYLRISLNKEIDFKLYLKELKSSIFKFIRTDIDSNIEELINSSDKGVSCISFISINNSEEKNKNIYYLLNTLKERLEETASYTTEAEFNSFFLDLKLRKNLKDSESLNRKVKI